MIVDYDPLPAVVDPEAALEDGAPLVQEEFGTNKTHDWAIGGGDVDAGLAEADVVVERRIVNHRTAGAPIEPRGSIGELPRRQAHALLDHPDPAHRALRLLAGMLGIPEDQLRVIAPDVGGGFGAKLQIYAEEVLAAARSRKRLGRPVKWIETRSEHMTATPPRPRPDQLRDARRQARRHAHRRCGSRSSPTSAPTSCCSRRSSRSSGFR